MSNGRIETRIAVATFNNDGDPDIMFVKVQATEEEIEKGYHYLCGKRYVVDQLDGDWDQPMVCFDCDRDNAGEGLASMFVWDSFTDVVEVTEKDVNGDTD